MKLNNVDEATRVCQEIRCLLKSKILTRKQAKVALTKVGYYKDLLE